MAVAFGALSLLVALPVGVALSYATTLVLSSFLNFDIYSFHFPSWVFATQGSIAIVAPLAAAFVPILAGTRTTVREAVSDYGIKGGKGGWIDNLLLAIRGLPRPVMLSLRNTFQRKGRLALTLATLTIAGAIFISIINTRNALLGQFDKFMDLFGFDIQVSLNHPENINRLTREAKRIDGVEEVEGWGAASGTIMRPEGVSVQPVDSGFQHAHPGGRSGFAGDEGSIRGEESSEVGTSITILAPPVDTTFIKPDISQGRWLEEGDYGVIVLSTEVLRTEPYIKVGDRIEVDFGDKQRYLTVVGVINLVGMPFAYAPFDYVTRLEGTAGLSSVAMLGTSEDDPAFQEVVAREVEDHFQDIGIGVSQTNTIASLLGSMISQIDFLILLMLFMAGMLGVVGGLGLASTMSLSVLERTREIGVMRSVGASNRSIRSIFLTEGMIIGLMSVAMASLLSVPISYALGTALGNVFFQHPLDLVLKPGSFAAWLVIAMVISSVASLVPANQATQISVRESISYE
jgi:putative ABC transport system permease protein